MTNTYNVKINDNDTEIRIEYGLLFIPEFRFYINKKLAKKINIYHNLSFSIDFEFEGIDFNFKISDGVFRLKREVSIFANKNELNIIDSF